VASHHFARNRCLGASLRGEHYDSVIKIDDSRSWEQESVSRCFDVGMAHSEAEARADLMHLKQAVKKRTLRRPKALIEP
jgi:hypothetical protein